MPLVSTSECTSEPAPGASAKKPDRRITIQIRRLDTVEGEKQYLGSCTVSESFLGPIKGLFQTFKQLDRQQRQARRKLRKAG